MVIINAATILKNVYMRTSVFTKQAANLAQFTGSTINCASWTETCRAGCCEFMFRIIKSFCFQPNFCYFIRPNNVFHKLQIR